MSVPPTSEKGHPGGFEPIGVPDGRRRQKYAVSSPLDWAPELQFPASVVMYDTMRTETHLSAVLEAVLQPIYTADWHLDERGVDPEVMDLCNTELGLGEDDALSRVSRAGVRIYDHVVETASTLLWAGFSCSEILWNPGPPTPAQLKLGITDEVVHLRKLGSRPPRTITKIETDRDGGLRSIHQKPLGDSPLQEDVEIPVKQLVFYSLNKEGSDWTGRSMLRNAYQAWALKDIFLRMDAQAVEKHAMGYWVGRTTDPGRADAMLEMIEGLRTGENAGAVLMTGDELELMGMSGSTINVIDRLNYLDQAMSRSALAMFLDLGHDNGARSLGETHLRVFQQKIQAVADYIGRTVTEHVIRELVEHNYGEGTPYPALVPGDIAAQQGVSSEVLNGLLTSGAITWDKGLEDHNRTTYGLPPLPRGFVRPEDKAAQAAQEQAKAQTEIARTTPAATVTPIGPGRPTAETERTVAASAFERATAAYEALRARVAAE